MRKLLLEELRWHETRRGQSGKGEDYENGFVAGLQQAGFMAEQLELVEVGDAPVAQPPCKCVNPKHSDEYGHEVTCPRNSEYAPAAPSPAEHGLERTIVTEILANCALHYIQGPQWNIDRAIENATRILVNAHFRTQVLRECDNKLAEFADDAAKFDSDVIHALSAWLRDQSSK